MNNTEAFHVLLDIMEDTLDCETNLYSEETLIEEVEDWDSLSQVQIIMALMKRFQVRFTTAEILSWKKLGDLVESVLNNSEK